MNRTTQTIAQMIAFIFTCVCLCFWACKKAETDEDAAAATEKNDGEAGTKTSTGGDSTAATITGGVTSASGSSEDLKDWHVFLLEKSTGFGHLATIAANGGYTLTGVDMSKTYTMLLFSRDLQLMSAYAAASSTSGEMNPYFKIKKTIIPYLVLQGPSLSFSDVNDIALDSTAAVDVDNNGVPDGLESMWNLTEDKSSDTDRDGIPDKFDRDDDGDGIPDFLDSDSDESGSSDNAKASHDQFFNSHLQHAAVTLEKMDKSGGTSEYYLTFIAKTAVTATVSGISIQGPATVLTDATGVNIAGTSETWTGALLDDGGHFDQQAGDGIFGGRVQILSTALPRRYHGLFFKTGVVLSPTATVNYYFPTIFPDVELGSIGASVSASNVLTISGSPLGNNQSFAWSVFIYDADGGLLFTNSFTSATTTYDLPTDALPAKDGLSLKVVATSPQRLLGYPSYKIHSVPVTLNLAL